MNHKLLAARAPLAWIALGLVVVTALVHILVAGARGVVGVGTVAGAVTADAVSLLIMVLLVLSCLLPPVPRAVKALVISSAVVTSLLTIAVVVQAITYMQAATPPARWWDVLAAGALSAIVPRLALTIVAWVLVACLVSPSGADAPQPRALEGGEFSDSGSDGVQAATEDATEGEAAPPEVPSSEDQAPTWQLDKASGVVWQSAAAAATGAQGSGYGMPGQARGSWQPAPALRSAESPDSAEDISSAERDPAGPDPAGPDPAGTDPAGQSESDSAAAREEPADDEPTGTLPVQPPGRRFAASARPADSPSSADSPPRN